MANELQVVSTQLPANLEELVSFVKVGREKLVSVRAEIRAIEKLNMEQEVRMSKVREAQDISEALLDAEVKLGEIMATLPTAPGKRTDLEEPVDSAVPKSKKEILKEAGFSEKTAQRYELMAKHPDVVAQIKAEARERSAIVSRTSVLRAIEQVVQDARKKDWVAQEDERHTDSGDIYLAWKVMGGIDLDPAAIPIAHDIYNFDHTPKKYYTKEDNGLVQPWEGNVYLYPPYSQINEFIDKLIESRDTVPQAIVHVRHEVDAEWYEKLASISNAVVFKRGYDFFYYGSHAKKFLNHFIEGTRIWGIENFDPKKYT